MRANQCVDWLACSRIRFWVFVASALCLLCCLMSLERHASSHGVAVPSTINHRLLTVNHSSSTVEHQPLSISHRPSTIDGPYVASSIKDVYHRTTCRYAKSMEHAVSYDSPEEAQASGKVPCKVCLPVIEVSVR